jgi:hypothetical protein
MNYSRGVNSDDMVLTKDLGHSLHVFGRFSSRPLVPFKDLISKGPP